MREWRIEPVQLDWPKVPDWRTWRAVILAALALPAAWFVLEWVRQYPALWPNGGYSFLGTIVALAAIFTMVLACLWLAADVPKLAHFYFVGHRMRMVVLSTGQCYIGSIEEVDMALCNESGIPVFDQIYQIGGWNRAGAANGDLASRRIPGGGLAWYSGNGRNPSAVDRYGGTIAMIPGEEDRYQRLTETFVSVDELASVTRRAIYALLTLHKLTGKRGALAPNNTNRRVHEAIAEALSGLGLSGRIIISEDTLAYFSEWDEERIGAEIAGGALRMTPPNDRAK